MRSILVPRPGLSSSCRRSGWALCLALVCAASLASVRAASAEEHVLVLIAEAASAPGAIILRDSLKQGLESPPLSAEVFAESLDTTRFPNQEHEQALSELIAAKYINEPPTLIIPIGQPALAFTLRHRARLFPNAPILFGLIDERMPADGRLGKDISGVYVRVEAAQTVRTVASLVPRLRHVVVVGGTSPFDRGWLDVVRADLDNLGPDIETTYVTGLPLKGVLGEIGGLGDDSAVLFVSMASDGSGVVRASPDVVRILRRATDVPIVGLSTTYLGNGILGGRLIDFSAHGRDLVTAAKQYLSGSGARSLPAPFTTHSLLAFDSRELSRFGLNEKVLPVGTTVAFRDEGFWVRNQYPLVAALVGVVLLLLGSAGLVQRHRHLRNERMLTARRRLSALVEELLAGFTVSPQRLDDAIRSGLKRVGEATGADDVWLWEPRPGDDLGWMPLALQSGETVSLSFDPGTDVPPPIAERAAETGQRPGTAVAAALRMGERLLGVLFWTSQSNPAPQDVVQDLKVIGETFAQALQRLHADEAIDNSERLKNSVLSSLVSPIAVLDRNGVIIEVNEVWKRYARANGVRDMSTVLPGANYRQVCEKAAHDGVPEAAAALAAIDRACAGDPVEIEVEYELAGRHAHRWFSMRPSPLMRDEGGAVVIHQEITAQKKAEQVLHSVSRRLLAAQESERRRIARDLHDDLGQRVALLAIEIDQAAMREDDGAQERIKALGERTAEIATEIHRLSHSLHSSKLDALGLVAAVRGHCREMNTLGLDVTFTDENVPSNLSPDVRLALFRVVQEALNNVAKHSGARHADVFLYGDPRGVEVRIADGGRGFTLPSQENGGLGLVGMRERLGMLGGTLIVQSRDGMGTTIIARVPAAASQDGTNIVEAVG